MKLMVLNNNKEIDNNKLGLLELTKKLEEEVNEVIKATESENKHNIISEVLDVVQVSIAMLDKLYASGIDIEKEVDKHNKKLLSRLWSYKAVIKVQVTKSY